MVLRVFFALASAISLSATCGATPPPAIQPASLATESTVETAVPSPAPVSAPAPVPDPAPIPAPCPSESVLVEGDYCPTPLHVCKRWIDPPGPYQFYRCAEYEEPATCTVPRERKRFCIDEDEYVKPGDLLPLAHQSWTSADAICTSRGMRLCLESEWQFACEGEQMRPYPYGFKRDATACNIDRANLGKPNNGLNDLRAPIGDYPNCKSPFGVHDMSGNVEEWATQDHGHLPDRSTMKGAWWLPGKNTCRAATVGHGEIYEGPQVGVRCCKDSG